MPEKESPVISYEQALIYTLLSGIPEERSVRERLLTDLIGSSLEHPLIVSVRDEVQNSIQTLINETRVVSNLVDTGEGRLKRNDGTYFERCAYTHLSVPHIQDLQEVTRAYLSKH